MTHNHSQVLHMMILLRKPIRRLPQFDFDLADKKKRWFRNDTVAVRVPNRSVTNHRSTLFAVPQPYRSNQCTYAFIDRSALAFPCNRSNSSTIDDRLTCIVAQRLSAQKQKSAFNNNEATRTAEETCRKCQGWNGVVLASKGRIDDAPRNASFGLGMYTYQSINTKNSLLQCQ